MAITEQKEREKQEALTKKEERKRKREEYKNKNAEKKSHKKDTKDNKPEKTDSDDTSDETLGKIEILEKDLHCGVFVVVKYEEDFYPGKITKIEKKEYLVSTMARSGLQDWK